MKTTLNLDDELLRAAKRRAADRGVTLTSVLEDALRRLLTEPPTEPYVLDFPVVHGGGPLKVDISNNAKLLETLT